MAAGAQYTQQDINNQVLSICRDFTTLAQRIVAQNQFFNQIGGAAVLQSAYGFTETDANNIIGAVFDLNALMAIAGPTDGVSGNGQALAQGRNFFALVRWCRGNGWS